MPVQRILKGGRRRPPALFPAPRRKGRVRSFDGTTLAWSLFGPPTGRGLPIVCLNGIGVSTFFWKYLVGYFSPSHPVLLWDYRGHGSSELPKVPENVTMESNARDLAAVMDAAELNRGLIIGHSMGAQVLFEFYRRFPRRVSALVPFLGTYKNPVDTFFDTEYSRYLFEAAHFLVKTLPGPATRLVRSVVRNPLTLPLARLFLINPDLMKEEDLRPYLDHLARLDLVFFFRMAKEMQNHSAEDVLARIKVPTLILGGTDDVFTPVRLSQEMHRRIRGSELLIIPLGSHAAIVEQPQLVNLRLEKFMRDHALA